MKYTSFLMLLVFFTPVSGQETNNSLASLIATEYAFAASARDIGTHDAFLSYIADDGILFRPEPVNGKEYLLDSKPTDGILNWYPVHAAVSNIGDLGFTTGPWEMSIKEKDSIKTLYGNYCTVWERNTDGDWLFVIDFGNQNEKPKSPPVKLRSSRNYSVKPIKNIINVKEIPVELFELDKQLKSDSYAKYLSPESRILRNGSFPFLGTETTSELISRNELFCCFQPKGGRISLSNDFGFTYGKCENSNTNKSMREMFDYLHVWKKEGRQWILIADIAKKSGE